MADGSSRRRFSREEMALILRRATEGERRLERHAQDGLTLEEIVAAAREAGIDPVTVRRAAALAQARPDAVQKTFTGSAVNPVLTGRFPGQLPREGLDAVRRSIEDAMGRPGQWDVHASGFLWQEDHGFGRTYLRARQEGAALAVSIEAERKGHLLALMLVLATAVALLLQPIGGFAGLSTLVGPMLALLAPVVAVAVGTRMLWPRLQGPLIRRMETAVLEVGAYVEGEEQGEGDAGPSA